ncbi:UDP-N-acetylenolpyruvoylglucosamine reductase [Halomicronema hongdechloris C2206]|uniref:UDP-N-acetylenolpyruvoylglucosamine reductase n=1 Tax=Halomicronema hongdechloris C2206 TaxID=1641165 RepID=A0A1Z3HRW3_9CYAN|nr:UDP-N-acetylmuramate dehydrogenase [Halomicronema hongdechloris]ASC72867.1 UDP-N-acetylenolpyruvoylglucosamine reductase [Halomicronema hongdechloris C2206]
MTSVINTSSVLPRIDCPIHAHSPLGPFTTFRVGGAADWLAIPRTEAQLLNSLQWAHSLELPTRLLGAGSNLLISDQGLSGLVIVTRHLRQVTFDDDTGQVTAMAGEPLPTLAWKAAKRGWRGLEWAAGIPGTVGGAVVMNAGAHGASMADILVRVDVLNSDATTGAMMPVDLQFRYRTSVLQHRSKPVVRAVFQLEPGYDPKQVTADTLRDLKHRRATQPYHLPSCGSVFRNPLPYTAGWIIEQTGLKGYRIGAAQVSELHANFILNQGGATATDIFRLISHIQGKVLEQWSLQLETEVKILGPFPAI